MPLSRGRALGRYAQSIPAWQTSLVYIAHISVFLSTSWGPAAQPSESTDPVKNFNILVLKTNMTIPYASVFIRLDCKYWSADAETRMRAKMAAVPPAH